MASDDKLLRDHARITSLDELETAKKRAEINATQDRLFLQNSIGEIKTEGPKVVLKNVVLPLAVAGVATYGVIKLVSKLTSSDNRQYFREPHFDDAYVYRDDGYPTRVTRAQPVHVAQRAQKPSTLKRLATYLPVAIKVSKMAVSYLEKNGTTVPPLVHNLLAGPGNKAASEV